MTELQKYVENYGFGISVRDLAHNAYRYMECNGHDVCIINDRYLEVDGVAYLFSKSKKHGRWIVKTL